MKKLVGKKKGKGKTHIIPAHMGGKSLYNKEHHKRTARKWSRR